MKKIRAEENFQTSFLNPKAECDFLKKQDCTPLINS